VSITGLWSGLFAGIVIGVLGRLLTPRRPRQLGCILTILIGIAGAAIGTAVGAAADTGDVLTFVFQVVAAALLVTVFGAATRRT
jgi:uncharacterized membrane protein YeaQ/YmgE (transglycosylase-associated protein family)